MTTCLMQAKLFKSLAIQIRFNMFVTLLTVQMKDEINQRHRFSGKRDNLLCCSWGVKDEHSAHIKLVTE